MKHIYFDLCGGKMGHILCYVDVHMYLLSPDQLRKLCSNANVFWFRNISRAINQPFNLSLLAYIDWLIIDKIYGETPL